MADSGSRRFRLTAGKPSFLVGRLADAACSLRVGLASGTDALQKLLQPHLLGVLGLNPAAQVIRQRGVHPIAARA